MDAVHHVEATGVVAFMNTLDVDAGRDDLEDLESFAAWLERSDDVRRRAAVTAAALLRARRLRDSLRRLARTNHDGGVDRDALADLDTLARELGVTVRFEPGDVEIVSDAGGADGVLGDLLAAAATAMRRGAWSRVKLCADDTCAEAFVDASRNRSARWCSMAGCGNRAKARAYRSRGTDTPGT